MLESAGFRVVATSEAERIPELAREHLPDVLLQDVRMPGLDVHRLIEQIRADPATSDIPVLLFSAGMDLDEVASRVGANGVLEKPFAPHQLIAAIGGAPAEA
ncbi:MAG: two-component system, OmpR family, alkaline phosphatase synthesis response regulator PhoP [Thermoplasmata archaeon]|nr:two-component system, OmpR family, alkaline phosphatase synthesis response regulator PhoP [Thermoplasmata archaeon]